jgi:hypothetical protein
LWLQVTSFDKRIDLPRIHLDRHQLPSEFSAPAKETNPLRRSFRVAHVRCELRAGHHSVRISFVRLTIHCQSPELQQPARAGKVGASGPHAHLTARRGGDAQPVHGPPICDAFRRICRSDASSTALTSFRLKTIGEPVLIDLFCSAFRPMKRSISAAANRHQCKIRLSWNGITARRRHVLGRFDGI